MSLYKIEVRFSRAEDEDAAGVGARDQEPDSFRTGNEFEVDHESVSVNRNRLETSGLLNRDRVEMFRVRNVPDFDGGIGRCRGEQERIRFGSEAVDAGH